MYLFRIYFVFILYLFYIYFVFISYLFCIYFVFILYLFCIYFVFILYLFCIYFVFACFEKFRRRVFKMYLGVTFQIATGDLHKCVYCLCTSGVYLGGGGRGLVPGLRPRSIPGPPGALGI